jgi:hypothetical protein
MTPAGADKLGRYCITAVLIQAQEVSIDRLLGSSYILSSVDRAVWDPICRYPRWENGQVNSHYTF